VGFPAKDVRLGGVTGDTEARDDVLGVSEEGSGGGLEVFGILGFGGLEVGRELVIPDTPEGGFLAGGEKL
jgi:hypothetical protein